MAYRVSVAYNHTINSRSLSAYRVDVSETAEEPTGKLDWRNGERVVENNTEHHTGVFNTISELAAALSRFVTPHWTIWQEGASGEFFLTRPSRKRNPYPGSQRVATFNGVEHDLAVWE